MFCNSISYMEILEEVKDCVKNRHRAKWRDNITEIIHQYLMTEAEVTLKARNRTLYLFKHPTGKRRSRGGEEEEKAPKRLVRLPPPSRPKCNLMSKVSLMSCALFRAGLSTSSSRKHSLHHCSPQTAGTFNMIKFVNP